MRVNVRDSPMTQDGLTAGPHTVGRVASWLSNMTSGTVAGVC